MRVWIIDPDTPIYQIEEMAERGIEIICKYGLFIAKEPERED